MTNIITFQYLHRDGGNYKDQLEARFLDPQNRDAADLETMIRERLIDGEYFYPEDIKLDRSSWAEEFDWHEFNGIFVISQLAGVFPANAQNFDEFLEILAESKRKHVSHIPKIYTKPRLARLRLFVSSLELRRKLHGVQILAAVADPDMAVLSMPKESWKLIQETLCLDAESAAFEGNLRDEISRALAHVEEW